MTGIYVFYNQNRCIYVGSSVNIEKRIRQHAHRGKFTRIEIHLCEEEELQGKEQSFIDDLKPILNRMPAGKRRKRAIIASRIAAVHTDEENIRRLDKHAERLRRSRNSLINEGIEMLLESITTPINLKQIDNRNKSKKKAGAR